MRWKAWAYPVLFALFPLFAMAAINPGWYRLRAVFLLAALMAIGTLAVMAALALCLRARYSWPAASDRAAIVMVPVIIVFYAIDRFPRPSVKEMARTHPVLLVAGLALFLYAALWLRRRRWHDRPLAAASGYLTLVAGLLCAWSIARVLYYPIATAIDVHRSAFVDSLEQPVPRRSGAVARQPKRDVIVIVLDAYASGRVLHDRYGFDNSRFEDSLRALGFRIPTALRSNYPNTVMSVGSLVNFAQMRGIASDAGIDSHDYGPADYLVEHNRAARFLRSQGYRYVFFPSTWYAATRYSTDADVEFSPYERFNLGRSIYRSVFIAEFINSTILGRALPWFADRSAVYRDHIVKTLEGVTALEPSTRPTFAFVHVLMPHVPYVVDAGCHTAVAVMRDIPRAREQFACIDSLVLATVTTVLRRARVAPIIILEGDHGTQSLNIFASRTRLPTPAQSEERFQPFGAYYLPDGGGATVPDSTSVVNVLRYVFSYYNGADLPPLPNTMYYSHWKFPYRLTELNDHFAPVNGYTAANRPLAPRGRASTPVATDGAD